MKFRWPWQKHNQEDELASLDAMLKSAFQPVTPNSEFLHGLRETLIAGEQKVLGLSRRSVEQLLLVLGAIASGVLLIITGIRTIINLIGAFGKLRASRGKQDPPPGTISDP